MATIQTASCALNYRFDGAEHLPVLLMSNSLGTNLAMWDDQIAMLTPHFRVLRYDTRGHGNSDVPSGDYTMTQVAGDALALMDALKIERAHFCGLSMGGMVGMWLASNAPARINKLVLCNTGAHMPPANLWTERIQMVLAKGMAPLAPNVLTRWFTPSFISNHPTQAARIQTMLETTPAVGYAGCCAAIRDMDQRESIQKITAQTMVIAGTHDPATPPAAGQFIAAQIPQAKYVELNAAHYRMWKTPRPLMKHC